MGIITVDKMNHLFWLGRYIERVNTTLKAYFDVFDIMIDSDENYYEKICSQIGIPNIYTSKADFITRYPYDATDPNSIMSNLKRAYDNAIVMRDYIGTETMAYVQLAIFDLEAAKVSKESYRNLHYAIDHIFAFWGCVDDQVDDNMVKGILRIGKRYERIDLYLCLKKPLCDILPELDRLEKRLAETHMKFNESTMYTFKNMLNDKKFNYSNARALFATLFDV